MASDARAMQHEAILDSISQMLQITDVVINFDAFASTLHIHSHLFASQQRRAASVTNEMLSLQTKQLPLVRMSPLVGRSLCAWKRQNVQHVRASIINLWDDCWGWERSQMWIWFVDWLLLNVHLKIEFFRLQIELQIPWNFLRRTVHVIQLPPQDDVAAVPLRSLSLIRCSLFCRLSH